MSSHDTKTIIINTVKTLQKGSVNQIVRSLPQKRSRQWVSATLNELARNGQLIRSKEGKEVFFVTSDNLELIGKKIQKTLLNDNLNEDLIFNELKNQTPFLTNLQEDTEGILNYSFTEMLNNAIDHSKSKNIIVTLEEIDEKITFDVVDKGIGVFRNIMNKKSLPTELDAIQELLKGKTTTLPHSHSGEGIFFTSKISDLFILDSYGYKLRVDNNLPDIFIEKAKSFEGTRVHFELSIKSKKHLSDIFREYEAEPNSQAFDKTKVHVKLLKAGTVYISRSQAKRLMNNLDKFKLVILDFEGIDTVGQAFADEVFRVFVYKFPQTRLEPINMSETVSFMVNRSQKSQLSFNIDESNSSNQNNN